MVCCCLLYYSNKLIYNLSVQKKKKNLHERKLFNKVNLIYLDTLLFQSKIGKLSIPSFDLTFFFYYVYINV